MIKLNGESVTLDKVADFAHNNSLAHIEIQLQSGPIKEVGINGVQIDDVVELVRNIIEGFNMDYPCRENSIVITKLDEALLWLLKRKMDREKRGVEGTHAK